ncbi:hypothetical protein HMPREF1092_02373 [Clostridium thermobutyricum]|uniref:DUF4003 domain-containing protein n=1 Tax=Clostridium thermobutyricum TaxID=29372 RepID=N9WCJ9_9CLOT|nr:DUF4003 family protein [Clostridium thermobutyricum]ENZ00721.1 hypothetical protein HMPREF1092_02373 [Clostridium thermobutyricum]
MEEKYLELFLKNNYLLDKAFGNKANSVTVKFTALAYTLYREIVNLDNIEEIHSLIAIKTDEQSPFREENYYILTMLLTLTENSEDFLDCVLDAYSNLEVFFNANNFLSLTSEILCSYNSKLNIDTAIEDLRHTYSLFKERHWFLTGTEDISICALINSNFNNTLLKINEAESCYKYLKDIKFFPNNNVQLLSQILSFSEKPLKEKCMSAVRLQGFLEKEGIIIRDISLPLLGFVVLTLDDHETFINTFKKIDLKLKLNDKFSAFKIKEELRFIISGCLTILTLTHSTYDKNTMQLIFWFVLNISTKATTAFLETAINRIFID